MRDDRGHADLDPQREAPRGRRRRTSMLDAFREADNVCDRVQGITDLITIPGLSTSTRRRWTIMQDAGSALMGIRHGRAEEPLGEAARRPSPRAARGVGRRATHPAQHHGRQRTSACSRSRGRGDNPGRRRPEREHHLRGRDRRGHGREDVRVTVIRDGSTTVPAALPARDTRASAPIAARASRASALGRSRSPTTNRRPRRSCARSARVALRTRRAQATDGACASVGPQCAARR